MRGFTPCFSKRALRCLRSEPAGAVRCKGRAFCPSCTRRRMSDTAAHLVDRVFPETLVRQCPYSRSSTNPRHEAGPACQFGLPRTTYFRSWSTNRDDIFVCDIAARPLSVSISDFVNPAASWAMLASRIRDWEARRLAEAARV